jgi:ERCC4-type nuclease
MNLFLEIDYRERSFIKLINEMDEIKASDITYKFKDMTYKISNLPIGDFVLKDDEGTFYVIERKTINDLCASITDNRFSEQKERILESVGDHNKVVYIIEGSKTKISNFSRITKSTVDSAIQNLILKHNYKVIYSDSIDDTVEQLLLLYKKLKTGALTLKPSTCHLVKKSDSIDIFINQLCVIPGVSLTIAKKINELYKCMEDMVKNLKDPDCLSEIQITEKRKLGKKLSQKIYKALKVT